MVLFGVAGCLFFVVVIMMTFHTGMGTAGLFVVLRVYVCGRYGFGVGDRLGLYLQQPVLCHCLVHALVAVRDRVLAIVCILADWNFRFEHGDSHFSSLRFTALRTIVGL